MQQVEELRQRTEEGKDRIRQAKIAMERAWWEHWVEHAGHAVKPDPWVREPWRSKTCS